MSKTTRLYLIRHAEAAGNNERVFHGQTDSKVTETGFLQLKALSGLFKDIHLDAIYTSDLKRAYLTAEAVNTYSCLDIKTDPRLREINGGLWENVPFEDLPLRFPESFSTWESKPHMHVMPEGESMEDVLNRMVEVIEEIVRTNNGKTIAVVSHGAAIRSILTYALDLPFSRLNDMMWCENTAVTIIDFDENLCPKLIDNGNDAHITDGISTVRNQKWFLKFNNKKNK